MNAASLSWIYRLLKNVFGEVIKVVVIKIILTFNVSVLSSSLIVFKSSLRYQ